MKDTLTRTLSRYQRTFADFTVGQKVVALVGTGALVLAAFLVFKWASAPSYTPLYSDLSSSDASAIVEQLDASGTPYELTDGGSTVMVPRDAVYKLRLDMSAEGLPGSASGGYSILDDQGLSTSQFQEQTGFKRAMEGELSDTVEGLDDVDTAVVHLALPERQVFADEQQPPTASVLVSTRTGGSLEPQQVQAIVHLVASSVDGMDPADVTVADSTGRVLSSPDGVGGIDGSARDQQVSAVQDQLHTRLQGMLDRVVGPGNSTVQVTASLDFDTSITESTDYRADPDALPLSSSSSTEVYQGPAGGSGAGGVVGPDGEFAATGGAADGESSYTNEQQTQDNAIDTVVERRETAPGSIETLHVGVALDAATTQAYSAKEIRGLVADTIGINTDRGDTVRVSSMPFDRTAETAAAEALAAAETSAQAEATSDLYRKIGLGVGVALMLLLALFKGRRRDRAREQATSYVVEQLRQESTARAALEPAPAAALAALEESEQTEDQALRNELSDLIERQPEDVAALLRGWLTERS